MFVKFKFEKLNKPQNSIWFLFKSALTAIKLIVSINWKVSKGLLVPLKRSKFFNKSHSSWFSAFELQIFEKNAFRPKRLGAVYFAKLIVASRLVEGSFLSEPYLIDETSFKTRIKINNFYSKQTFDASQVRVMFLVNA